MSIPYLSRPYINIYVPNTKSTPIWFEKSVQSLANKIFSKKVVPQPIYVSETIDHMPITRIPQVALMGMSNCGKSSLINSLIHNISLEHPAQKYMSNAKMLNMPTFAPVSNNPGRTRHLFTFNLGESLSIVDLPGYGFAKGKMSVINTWNTLVEKYLDMATNLRRVLSLIDSTQGVSELDIELWNMLKGYNIPFHLVFTKVDTLSPMQLHTLNESTIEILKGYSGITFNYLNCTSSRNSLGIFELQCTLAQLVYEELSRSNIVK